jgi:hypothetical protein
MSVKVYLGKSNRANPDDVQNVRKVLGNFDVEIVEFTGGQYSHKDLNKCTLLVIVPDLSNYDDDDGEVGVGKGLYEQIESKIDDSYVLTFERMGVLYFRLVEDTDVSDYNDYINYSTACLSSDYFTLSDILMKRYGVSLKSTSGTSTSTTNIKDDDEYLVLVKN